MVTTEDKKRFLQNPVRPTAQINRYNANKKTPATRLAAPPKQPGGNSELLNQALAAINAPRTFSAKGFKGSAADARINTQKVRANRERTNALLGLAGIQMKEQGATGRTEMQGQNQLAGIEAQGGTHLAGIEAKGEQDMARTTLLGQNQLAGIEAQGGTQLAGIEAQGEIQKADTVLKGEQDTAKSTLLRQAEVDKINLKHQNTLEVNKLLAGYEADKALPTKFIKGDKDNPVDRVYDPNTGGVKRVFPKNAGFTQKDYNKTATKFGKIQDDAGKEKYLQKLMQKNPALAQQFMADLKESLQ